MKTKSLLVSCAVLVLLTPSPAQAHTLLSELLLKMLLQDVVLAPPEGPFQSHEAHFRPIIAGEVASGFEINQVEVPLAINSIMAAQLATIPLGSSSGGFSYTYDPALGTFSRESSTFGSAWVERALTAGQGRWNLGFTFQRATYDSLEGRDLDNGDVRVYLVHQDCCGTPNAPGVPPNPFFEGDVIENRLSLDLTSSVFSAYVNYGVTDRLDAGIVVPFVTIDMNASVQARVLRLATAENPGIHSFPGGQSERTFSESSRAQGLGDILLRAKYRFLDAAGGGLAAGVDVRLPTGDSEQLLGTGGTQVKLTFIGSSAQGPFSPHVNIGYTFSQGGSDEPLAVTPNVADEFSYSAGFDTALHPRLTFSADVLGRTLRDIGRLTPTRRQFPFVTQTGVFGTATFEEFTLRGGDLNLVVGAAGFRFNPRGNFLISAHVLIPFTESGLRDRVTPVLGIDYSF
jgi:hypothetical protein